MISIASINFVLTWVLVLSGAAFVIVGSLGILRLPDFWARLHAASVIESAGAILMLMGMSLWSGVALITIKLLMILIFLFVTGPTATHAIANAAMVSGLKPNSIKEKPNGEKKINSKTFT
tara:strand:+ start:166 stop:525 length:360 start_codon:yes stop_codon:yes gene_type:complete